MFNGYTEMFEKVKQNRIPQDVVEQIQEAILQGRLKAGDKLPAERELSEIFDASRGSVREALRVLEQKGLITVRPGANGGVFVKAVTTHEVSESLGLLLRYQRVSLRDLAEFREGVEGIVAGLATERAKEEDIQHLKHLLGEAKSHLEQGTSSWDAFIQVENRFHTALAYMTGNAIYESIVQPVYDNMHRYHDRFLPREETVMREIYRNLCGIVKAVEKGQAPKARLLARKHIHRFNQLAEEKG